MSVNEQANVRITLNNEQAKKEFKELQDEMKRLIDLRKKAEKAGDIKGFTKIDNKLKRATKSAKNYENQLYDVETALRDINGANMNDLLKAKRALNAQMKNLNRNTKEYVNKTKQLKKVRTEIRKINKETGVARGRFSMLKNMAGGLLPSFAFASIVAGAGRVLKSMFNLTKQIQGETIRATTVLGDQMGYVENQADKLAAKMGVTNREFVSMVANTGDLLIPLDFSRKKAAEMATQVQGLSGALDEWTAGKHGVAEVSNILTKAMLGEMEQLKGLGIAIRQDSEEFRNLVKQKIEDEGATNAQARAMATLELIYKKSADAQTAYTLEGNKLLRFQKSLNLAFKNFKENFATGFSESMKSATQQYIDQQKEVDNLEKNLNPLIDQYEKLSSKKIPLTADEQERLNGLMAQIAKIAPEAITEFDEYGRVIGISTERAKELVKAQRAMLSIKNADSIKETEKELDKIIKKIEKTEITVKRMNEATKGGTQISGNVKEWKGWYTGHIADLENWGQKRLGLETLLKTLKGEPLYDPEETKDSTEAVTSLIKAQEQLLEDAKKLPETTEAEITAKNKKIAVIETEIKRLRELGIEKVAQSKLDEFLAKSAQEQRLAAAEYFRKAGEEGIKAFLEAIEKGKEELPKSIFDLPEEEEEPIDPTSSFEIKKYKETYKFKRKFLDEQRKKGLIGEEEYLSRKFALNIDHYQGISEMSAQYANLGANMVYALMDMELEKAGDNEEKKKEIRKKYADINFVITASQIIANTAAAIMQGFAQLGPIGGAISAALLGVTGLAQLGIANAERQKVKGYEAGKYPILGENGERYNAKFAGRPVTGIYSGAHLGIFNEDPRNPEMVVDGITTRKIQINRPDITRAIHSMAGGATQFAAGKYPGPAFAAQQTVDEEDKQIKRLTLAVLNKLETKGVHAEIPMYNAGGTGIKQMLDEANAWENELDN
ncbi:MAG: hypothetical protein HQ541_15365 [Mariniphaga sp.]|nr:hypothetical protein [Mariniphaga sp.]